MRGSPSSECIISCVKIILFAQVSRTSDTSPCLVPCDPDVNHRRAYWILIFWRGLTMTINLKCYVRGSTLTPHSYISDILYLILWNEAKKYWFNNNALFFLLFVALSGVILKILSTKIAYTNLTIIISI